jgi:hypothetical protein
VWNNITCDGFANVKDERAIPSTPCQLQRMLVQLFVQGAGDRFVLMGLIQVLQQQEHR